MDQAERELLQLEHARATAAIQGEASRIAKALDDHAQVGRVLPRCAASLIWCTVVFCLR